MTEPAGISAPSPLPSPPGRATADLLGEFAVRGSAARRRVENGDRLPEGRRLGDPDGTGDDSPVHLLAEVRPHFLLDLLGEAGAGVVHREHDPSDIEGWVEVRSHERNVPQQLPETL